MRATTWPCRKSSWVSHVEAAAGETHAETAAARSPSAARTCASGQWPNQLEKRRPPKAVHAARWPSWPLDMLASWPGQPCALVAPAHLSLPACGAQACEQLGQTYFHTCGPGRLA
eukprot:5180226-Pyramimonas_sp.AAC.1